MDPRSKDVSEKTNLNRAILVRLSDDLHARVDAAAIASNQSTAAWVRVAVADALCAQVPIDRKRSPRRSPRPDLSSAEAEMKALVRALGRSGGALVQVCKSLREGHRPEHAGAEQVLRDVRAAAQDARAFVRKIGL